MSKKSTSNIFPPPPYKPFGRSYESWTIEWWRWLTSIPKNKNPAFDRRGNYCHLNQSHPRVWFLAGTFGGYAERKCTIGVNRAILFPIINIEATFRDTDVSNERDLVLYTQRHIDDIDQNGLTMIVDDEIICNLSKHRVRSPVFDLYLENYNVMNSPPGPTKATSDGYWIMLRPLSRGVHNLSFRGSCLSGLIRIGVKYEITIE